MKRFKDIIKAREGFSLAEIIIVVAIFSIILFSLTAFRGNLLVLNNFVNQRLQSRQDVEQTMQIMTTEIRSSGPSSLGAYEIEAATTSSLTFYSDIDRDGIYDRVRYFQSTSTLRKGVVKPVGNPLVYATSSEVITTVVNNLVLSSTTPIFRYYDTNYTGTQAALTMPVDVTAIRSVQVSLYADVNASTSPKAEYFNTLITVRNLRSN